MDKERSEVLREDDRREPRKVGARGAARHRVSWILFCTHVLENKMNVVGHADDFCPANGVVDLKIATAAPSEGADDALVVAVNEYVAVDNAHTLDVPDR